MACAMRVLSSGFGNDLHVCMQYASEHAASVGAARHRCSGASQLHCHQNADLPPWVQEPLKPLRSYFHCDGLGPSSVGLNYYLRVSSPKCPIFFCLVHLKHGMCACSMPEAAGHAVQVCKPPGGHQHIRSRDDGVRGPPCRHVRQDRHEGWRGAQV